jgi:hypothetical protein
VQHALDTLEKASVRIMEAFQPEEIANILHIMAKKQYKTCLFPELERRAETISGKFNPQAVANTLYCGRMRRWGQNRGIG